MKIFITIILLTISQIGYSCDCLWQGPFLDLAKKSETVILGKVIDYDVFVKTDKGDLYPTVMVLEVIEVILPISDSSKKVNEISWTNWFNKGKIKTIRILGNYASSCRPNVTNFSIDSTFLFALSMSEKRMYYYDIDFSLSNCGTYWLPVESGIVKVNFSDKNEQELKSDGQNQEIEISEIKKQLIEIR